MGVGFLEYISRGDNMRMRCSWTGLMRLISVAVRAGEWGGEWDWVVRFGFGDLVVRMMMGYGEGYPLLLCYGVVNPVVPRRRHREPHNCISKRLYALAKQSTPATT